MRLKSTKGEADMNYKELFVNTVNRRYCDITGIKKENLTIESNPIKKIKDNWIILLGFVALVIGLMLINFNVIYFLLCLGLIAFFEVLFLIGNKYSVTCDKDCISIKQYFQKFNIPYKNVKNVYVARTAHGIITHTYVLVIRCEDQLSLLREFEFPLLCTDIEKVVGFIDNFKIATQCDAATIKHDKRRSLRRIVENIFSIVCVIIIAWFCITKGIIKLP